MYEYKIVMVVTNDSGDEVAVDYTTLPYTDLDNAEYELAILKGRALCFSDGRDFRLQRRLVMDWEYFQENDIEKEV